MLINQLRVFYKQYKNSFWHKEAWVTNVPVYSAIKIFLKEIRIHHQLKNLLVFVPLLLGHHYSDWQKTFAVILTFFSFLFVTSSVYLLNDLKDLETDKLHPSKRYRPLASGQFPIGWALCLIPPFVFIGLATAYCVSFWLFLSVIIYLLITFFYSFYLKSLILIDVFTLAFLYSLRVLAGGLAAAVSISPWLLSFSLFFFLGLAYLKRYIELAAYQELGVAETKDKSYQTKTDIASIMSLGVASNYVSVLILALYINSASVRLLYKYPEVLWLSVVVILYFINYLWFMAARAKVNDDPILFLVKNRAFLLCSVLVGLVILLSNYI